MKLELHSASPTELLASGSGLVMRIVHGHRTSIADVDRLSRVFDTELGEVARVAFIQVIGQDTPPLEPGVRSHGAAVLERLGPQVAPVIVLDGQGFWTTTLRLGLRAFTAMLRKSSVRIEASVEAAAESFAREFEGFDVEGCVEAYRESVRYMRSL